MASSTLWSLLFKLQADNAELRGMLADSDRRIGAFESKVNRSSANVSRGFSQMSRGAGQVATGLDKLATRAALAAAGGLAAVVTTAASFEQAWAGVEKTTGVAGVASERLRRQFEDMAKAMPVAFEQLAGIGEAGGALGIATEDLDEFTDVVARLSVSTNLSADSAATALGQLANVLHMTSDEFRPFADSLVALGNAGASTEDQIVEIAARFAAAAKSAGLANTDILALASTVASSGIEVEAGGSSLSRLFNNVATNIGTANAKATAFADALGLSLAEFRAAWEHDALATFQDLLVVLNDLDQFEAAKLLKDIGVTNSRDVNTLRLLAQGYERLEADMDTSREAQGDLNRESQKFFDTTQGKWEILKNNVRAAADTIGGHLLPVVNEAMGDFVEWLSLAENQQGLEDFGKDLAEGARDVIEALKGADFSMLIDNMKGAANVAKTAFDLFGKLPPEVQQLAIAALVANKVTGGAVFDIAKGLGNLIGGALRTIHAAHVTVIGASVTGGPGGAGGRGRLPFVPPVWAAPAAAVAAPLMLSGSDNPSAQLSNDLRVLTGQLEKGEITQAEFNRQQAELLAMYPGMTPPDVSAAGPNVFAPLIESFDRFRKAQETSSIEKLLGVVSTDETLARLGRVTEMGMAGIGTSMQIGLTTGMDPVGDIATAILAAAEDPTAPAVMYEVNGHLAGLEEIQAAYLAQGDVKLAEKVQANIDTLHTLIGSSDVNNAIAELQRSEAATANIAKLNAAAHETARIDAMHDTLRAKNFSFSPSIAIEVYGSTIGGGATGAQIRGHVPVAFADGTWDVPGTGLAMLHEGEMVVPPFDAQAFRETTTGGGDSGIRDVHVHLEDRLEGRSVTHIGAQLKRIGKLGYFDELRARRR